MKLTRRTGTSSRTRLVLGGVAPFAIGLLALTGCGGDDGAPPLVDDDDTDGTGSVTTGVESSTGVDPSGVDGSSSGFVPVCQPDELRCSADGTAIEICDETGLEWNVDVTCGTYSECEPCDEGDDQCTVPSCIGPCQLTENDPSSAGCAFVVNRSLHPYQEFPDGLVITNPNPELSAAVQIFEVPEGVLDEELFESFNLEPGQSRTIELETEFVPGNSSNLRTGGIFRVYSDVPVIGYQHAPLRANRGNESALLLPDRVLGNDYVVLSYSSLDTTIRGASYFELVALQDDTRVEWTPRVDTAGNGLPIDPVAPGETGSLILNRYETIRIVPSVNVLPVQPGEKGYTEAFEPLDISGTVIHTDNPVWVSGGNRFSRVPLDEPGQGGSGDQLLEVLFPLQHWGRTYVLPSAPVRPYGFGFDAPNAEWEGFEEESHFRIYAGVADVTVTSDPPNPNFPVTLDAIGDFVDIEVETGINLVLDADRAFLPVQYIRSKNPTSINAIDGPAQTGYGDPAMVQMVPTEQYLSRYAFATGVDFLHNQVVVTRATNRNEDVQLQLQPPDLGPGDTNPNPIIRICPAGETGGTCSATFEPVSNNFEKALLELPSEGTYTAESDIPFGIIQYGSARLQSYDDDGNPFDDGGGVCPAATPEAPFCPATYAYPGGLKAETIFIP